MPRNNPLRPAVVLVADRTLSARYRVLFEGIFATMQTTETPRLMMKGLLSRKLPAGRDGRAPIAPLGIRRIESALLAAGGLGPDDVACATPESLGRLLGPWTKLVCVSSSDPLGEGMSNTTTRAFCRGTLYTRLWTGRMLRQIARAKDRFGFRVLFGGAGAWQYRRSPDVAAAQGIDCVFEGYFEPTGPQLVADILAGHEPPSLAGCTATGVEQVAPIRGASVMGAVELSRGCGKGCSFCVAGRTAMQHIAPDTIVADLETNVAAGVTNVVSGSEDFFRYGGRGPHVNFDALHGLLTQMRRVQGLRFMQIDHGNVSSIAQLSDDQLREIRRLLTWEAETDGLWVNLGVESANGRLVAAAGPGKVAPFDPDDWESIVREVVGKLQRTGFYPVVSLVLGLPGETAADVARTRRLVADLSEGRVVIFPVFHEPVLSGEAFHEGCMRADQLELFAACYELNFRRVPWLFWDNQRAGGVGWARRALVQTLGRGEVLLWRRRVRRMARRIGGDGEELQAPVAPQEAIE